VLPPLSQQVFFKVLRRRVWRFFWSRNFPALEGDRTPSCNPATLNHCSCAMKIWGRSLRGLQAMSGDWVLGDGTASLPPTSHCLVCLGEWC